MSAEIEKAINALRDCLHEQCKDFGPEEYMQVLEELDADIEGNIDALKEENPELFA